jgi:hypothetical protein
MGEKLLDVKDGGYYALTGYGMDETPRPTY